MLAVFDGVRELTMASICLRICLAAVCGGAIGIEREYKRRPAGFRTHILICLGAAMTTLTSQYLFQVMHYSTDIARLGAQVVAGIGFIGAGTIVVTRRQKVKGLTTAAGLWASAIVGLALGAGFYEGGILTTVLILMAELVFSRLEYWLLSVAPEVHLYIEYEEKTCLDQILALLREKNVKILNMELTRAVDGQHNHASAILFVRLNKRIRLHELMEQISRVQGIFRLEEL